MTAQEQKQELPWDCLWTDELLDLMPSIGKFLTSKCTGLAVLTQPDKAPALLYLCAYKSDYSPSGMGFSFYQGRPPVNESHLQDREKARKLHLLPEKLQKLYRDVHDGWVSESFTSGPLPIDKIKFLSEFISDADAFGKKGKQKPFNLEDLLQVVRKGSGDVICLDTSRSTPAKPIGVWYDHERPKKSSLDLDFWKSVNDLMAKSVKSLLDKEAVLK